MPFAKRYIDKNIVYPQFIEKDVSENLQNIVVIPCYNEPNIEDTLNSLFSCKQIPNIHTEVIVVVNSAENSSEEILSQNNETLRTLSSLKEKLKRNDFSIHVISIKDVRKKWAGAGFARKVGMDEAIRRFATIDNDNGIIISLDADCTVDLNYLSEIHIHSSDQPKSNFFTIHFEHPLDSENKNLVDGICHYELHMRYYRHAMMWAGYPHAIYTVGSAFAVRASAYVSQGGMNRKKAGEDFYFLHKLIPLGVYGNINTTKVTPAARLSDRVPFGTGPTLQKWIEGDDQLQTTYSFRAFEELKAFYDIYSNLFAKNKEDITKQIKQLPRKISNYLLEIDVVESIENLNKNCGTKESFTKRFFIDFDAFFILKFHNYWIQQEGERQNLIKATKQLIDIKGRTCNDISTKNLLLILREWDSTE